MKERRIQLIMKIGIPALLFLIYCQAVQAQSTQNKIKAVPQLIALWETDTLLTNNESAVYDAVTDAVYVSCMGKSDDIKDGDGFIAKLRLDGKIETLKWIEGLNCPKGLAIHDNKLLAIDINELVTIDIATSKVVNKVILGANNFFNDIDVASNGDVFLSESHTSEIFSYRNGKAQRYFLSPETAGVNGVHVAGNQLLFTGKNGVIYGLSKDLQLHMLADSCFNPDGVETYRGGYFCSSWQGKIYYFEESANTVKLVDTWSQKIYAGDIDVVEKKRILICPTLFSNKVIAYSIKD